MIYLQEENFEGETYGFISRSVAYALGYALLIVLLPIAFVGYLFSLFIKYEEVID